MNGTSSMSLSIVLVAVLFSLFSSNFQGNFLVKDNFVLLWMRICFMRISSQIETSIWIRIQLDFMVDPDTGDYKTRLCSIFD